MPKDLSEPDVQYEDEPGQGGVEADYHLCLFLFQRGLGDQGSLWLTTTQAIYITEHGVA